MRTTYTLFFLLLLAVSDRTIAQMNVGSTAAPNASAMLQVTSSNKGFLPPLVALTGASDASTISSPATGLLVYCTGSGGLTAGYYYWSGSAWVSLGTGNTSWLTTGNSGTNSASNFIGTTDNHPMVVKTNGIVKLFVDSTTKNVGINNSAPQAMLDILGTKAANNTTLNLVDSVNDYIQSNIQNTSLGTGAQAGYSATANNGTNTTNFAWMGINNQNFNNPQPWNIGGGDDVSFMGFGNNLYISNMSTSKPIIFTTGTSSSPYYAERMRITNAGYVGIGTTTPAYPLQIGTGINTTISSYGYLNATAPTGVVAGSSGVSPFSVYAAGRMAATEFDAYSDRRIKENISTFGADSAADLIHRLNTVTYQYIDKPAKGDQRKLGFISQEVEQVIPSAVGRSTEFIPNIFTMVTDGSANVVCNTAGIREGDEVRILTASGDQVLHVAAVRSAQQQVALGDGPSPAADEATAHIVLDWGNTRPEKNYFVYGTKVHDLRTIDFDQLTALCVGAIQQLQQENAGLRLRTAALEKRGDSADTDVLTRLAKMSRKERRQFLRDLR